LFQTEIRRNAYSVDEIAQTMFERLAENNTVEYSYTDEWPLDRLQKIVRNSLQKAGIKENEATERVKQEFLKAMKSLRRRASKVVRLGASDGEFKIISTKTRRAEVVNASQIRNGATKRVYYTKTSTDTLESDERIFFKEALNSDNYQLYQIDNPHDFKTPLGIIIADSGPEREFVRKLTDKENTAHFKAWLKSTSTGFYSVKYVWQKRGVPKQSNFNPDFFIQVRDDLICVVEIKAETEIAEPSDENRAKLQFAREHFMKINAHLESQGSSIRYHFNFLTPDNFGQFFAYLHENRIETFQSNLDAALLKVTD